MKVFISWSGDESRQVAQAMRDWLPLVSDSIEPYMSAQDNEAGVRWAETVAAQLDESDFGILCCTSTNLTSPWLLFEAGALSKSVDFARVVPLLHEVPTSELISPLSQFMAKKDDRDGVLHLVRAINRGLERPRTDVVLDQLFAVMWPGLEAKLTAIVAHAGPSEPTVPTRSERDLLEEVLQLLRAQAAVPARTGRLFTSKVDLDRARILEAETSRRSTSGPSEQDITDRLRSDLAEIDPRLRFRVDPIKDTLTLFVDAEVDLIARSAAVDEMETAASLLGLRLRVLDETPRS